MHVADSFRLGRWSVHPRLNQIEDGDRMLHLEPKVMDVLCHLARHPHEVVGREELLDAVWPGTAVGDDALTRALVELRRVLGDDARHPTYVETIPKRGYRLIGEVTRRPDEAPHVLPYPMARSADTGHPHVRPWPREGGPSPAPLRALRPEAPPELEAEPIIRRTSRRSAVRWLRPAALVVAGIAVTGGWHALRTPSGGHASPRTRPVTSYRGAEREPALSPDGERIAFTWAGTSGAVQNLYVKMVDGGDPVLVSSGTRDTFTPAWSPDGRRIAFIRHDETGEGEKAHGVFIVSALGGDERRVGTFSGGPGLSWSPDGESLALSHRERSPGPAAIHLLSLSTGRTRRLTSPPSNVLHGDHHPRFSPDGQTLAFLRGGLAAAEIVRVRVASGEERRLTFGNPNTQGLDWTPDGRAIVFSAARPGRPGVWSLWRIPSTGGQAEPLEIGEEATYPAISHARGRLAYSRMSVDYDVWRAPGPAAREEDEPAPLIASTGLDYFPRYSPDGARICFTSSRSGHWELWVADGNGKGARQLTFLENWLTIHGTFSPDGRRIAFTSMPEDNFDVYVVDSRGGRPRRRTAWPSDETGPEWSRDGRFIYFGSNREGRHQVWKMPAEGGVAVPITRHGGTQAFESIDGKSIYFGKQTPDGGPPGIWRMPAAGGEETLVHSRARFGDWAVGARGIGILNREDGPRPFFEWLDLESGDTRRLAAIDGPPLAFWPSVSPDGRWILYSVEDGTDSDIVVVDGFR